MFRAMGHDKWAKRAADGELDDNRMVPIIPALRRYSTRFNDRAEEGKPLGEPDAMSAAADYRDDRKNGNELYGPALRQGICYPEDHVGRAFVFLHRMLEKGLDA